MSDQLSSNHLPVDENIATTSSDNNELQTQFTDFTPANALNGQKNMRKFSCSKKNKRNAQGKLLLHRMNYSSGRILKNPTASMLRKSKLTKLKWVKKRKTIVLSNISGIKSIRSIRYNNCANSGNPKELDNEKNYYKPNIHVKSSKINISESKRRRICSSSLMSKRRPFQSGCNSSDKKSNEDDDQPKFLTSTPLSFDHFDDSCELPIVRTNTNTRRVKKLLSELAGELVQIYLKFIAHSFILFCFL